MCKDSPMPLCVVPRNAEEKAKLSAEIKERVVKRLLKYDGEVVTPVLRTQMLADILHEGWSFVAEKAQEGYVTKPREED